MTEPTDRARRPLIGGVIPTAVLGAVALPQLLLADRPPDRLARPLGPVGVSQRIDGIHCVASAPGLETLVAIVFVSASVRIVLVVRGRPRGGVLHGAAGRERGGGRPRLRPRRVATARVPLDAIDRADVVDVDPTAYGGWGGRVVAGTVTGTAAVVLRPGEVLGLYRPGKRDVVVTVDDAVTAAGVRNDLIRRTGRRPGAGGSAPAPPQR